MKMEEMNSAILNRCKTYQN